MSKRIVLFLAMFLTAVTGIVMWHVPTMSRQHYLNSQEDLLESLTWYLAGRDGENNITPLHVIERELGISSIGIINIDSINLRLPVKSGVDYYTINIAPGWVEETARIGELGNAVIAGHRNYTFGEMFNRLGEIVIGDIIEIQTTDGLMQFEVFEKTVIEPTDQIAFLQPLNDVVITLYTCTPIEISSHRLIIRAILI